MAIIRVHEDKSRVRLIVVCSDAELQATAERSFRRGLKSQRFIDLVDAEFDFGISVALSAEPNGAPQLQSVAVSVCVVAEGPFEALVSTDGLESHRLVLHDLAICTRTELATMCEVLASKVANQLLSPFDLDPNANDALRAGETDLIDVDWIKRSER